MTLPNVAITKTDGNTGAVRPDADGILAIIAPSQIGTANLASSFARPDLMLGAMGYGPLVEYGAYDLAVAQKPVLAIRPTTSTAATYASVVHTGVAGTSVPTAGGTAPLDDYDVRVTIVAGGTIGVAGITYKYSLDGGNVVSAVQALGTSSTLTIPNSGVSFALAAGTLLAGDAFSCLVRHARMTDANITTALEALRVTTIPWEGVLIDGDIGTGTVAIVDTWLQGLEATGEFHFALLNTRSKTVPAPTAESEAAFASSISTAVASDSSIRICVGTDGGDLPSSVTGLTLFRPTALAIAARAMKIPIGKDAGYVADGPVDGFKIADGNGNPKWHDESLYPGLDDQRLVTLRSVSGKTGVFITNPNVISPAGSDYVFLQHIRTMNKACAIAYQILTERLGLSVGKKAPDPVTHLVYILEQDAQLIEAYVNEALAAPLKGQVADYRFVLSRTDDLSANTGATVNGQVQIEALAYLKHFNINTSFVKTITANV